MDDEREYQRRMEAFKAAQVPALARAPARRGPSQPDRCTRQAEVNAQRTQALLAVKQRRDKEAQARDALISRVRVCAPLPHRGPAPPPAQQGAWRGGHRLRHRPCAAAPLCWTPSSRSATSSSLSSSARSWKSGAYIPGGVRFLRRW